MDEFEKRERMRQARDDLDRSRADLERSMAERDATRHCLSDRPPIEQAGDGLEFKTTVTETQDWSGWERWLQRHLQRERELTNESVGSALAAMLKEEREQSKQELSDEIRKLRIELTNLETTLAELKGIIASERAGVIDTPNPLAPRRDN
jgi:hypothetical protein